MLNNSTKWGICWEWRYSHMHRGCLTSATI